MATANTRGSVGDLQKAFREHRGAMSLAEVALLFDVKEAKVRDWAKKGMPTIPGSSPVCVNWSEALKWFITSFASPRYSMGLRPICRNCGGPA